MLKENRDLYAYTHTLKFKKEKFAYLDMIFSQNWLISLIDQFMMKKFEIKFYIWLVF